MPLFLFNKMILRFNWNNKQVKQRIMQERLPLPGTKENNYAMRIESRKPYHPRIVK